MKIKRFCNPQPGIIAGPEQFQVQLHWREHEGAGLIAEKLNAQLEEISMLKAELKLYTEFHQIIHDWVRQEVEDQEETLENLRSVLEACEFDREPVTEMMPEAEKGEHDQQHSSGP